MIGRLDDSLVSARRHQTLWPGAGVNEESNGLRSQLTRQGADSTLEPGWKLKCRVCGKDDSR